MQGYGQVYLRKEEVLHISWGPSRVDGDFGFCTLAAVQNFQTKHGLASDGIVGPITLKALIN